MSDIQFEKFVRKPYAVKAVMITEDNIVEIAKHIGEVRIREGDNEPYIAVDARLVPVIKRAHLGWYVTKVGDNYRCFAPKVFRQQFTDFPDTDMEFTFPVSDLRFEDTRPVSKESGEAVQTV